MGTALVTSFHFPGDYIFALPTRPVLTAPNIGTTLDATFSDSTPALFDPVTITLPAGFLVSTDPANVAVLVGQRGRHGQFGRRRRLDHRRDARSGIEWHGRDHRAVPTGDPSVCLHPVEHPYHIGAEPDATCGHGRSATAPTITTPGVGASATTPDGGTFTGADVTGDGGVALAQYYKFDMPTAGNITITLNWGNDSDVDLIVCDDVGGVSTRLRVSSMPLAPSPRARPMR